MTAGRRGRGPLPARKMVAAEHNILEKQRCSHMQTSGSADLFGCTVAVHAGDLVVSSPRSSIAMERVPDFSAAHRLRPSLRMLPRGRPITTAEDAYRFEFVWIDGDRLPFDA